VTPDTPSVDLPWPSRRGLLAGAALGAVALVATTGLPTVAVPVGRDRARFLSEEQLATLGAVVDRVVPGEDGTPGALEVGAHESIDALLGAFRTDPPRIYAGGPFSDRAGSKVNHFERFLPLDAYERKAWKGKVRRFQKTYTQGLDALAASTPGFATLPGPARDLVLRTSQDPAVTAMMGLAVSHAFEGTWGAPEYGGNRDTLGWQAIGFEGDRQPRGYTDDEVLNPPLEPLPVLDVTAALGAYGPAMALATSEASMGLLALADGDARVLSTAVQRLLADADGVLDGVADGVRDGDLGGALEELLGGVLGGVLGGSRGDRR
jgi:hypothetical protein